MDLATLLKQPILLLRLSIVAANTMVQPPPKPAAVSRRLILAAGIVIFCLGCG
jgi:hypothetical protein